MKYYKKYTFDSKEQAEGLINALPTIIEEGVVYPNYRHTIVKLGYLPIHSGEYNEEGEEIFPPVYSDKYSVDVLWKGLELDEDGEPIFPEGWEQYLLTGLDSYMHNFYGLTYDE
jgi:hypothetical protein